VSRVVFPGTLLLTMTASAFQVFAIAILASRLIDDLDLSRAQLGLIGSVNTAVGALTAPMTGRLTDRIGPRRSVVAVLVTSALCMAVMAGATNIWWLFVSAAIGGLPQGWGNPATNSLIATRVPPGSRGGLTGIKQSGVTLGVFLSGASLPALAALWGWRGAVLAFAGLFAVLAIAVQMTLGPDPGSHRTAAAADGTKVPTTALDPFVWRLALYALLMGTAGGAVGRFFPLFAEESLDFSLATAGLLTALAGLMGMAARVMVGRWAERRIQPTRLLSVLAMVGVLYCVLLAVVDESTRALLYLSPPLNAIGIAAWNAVAMLAIIMFYTTAQAGRASGIVMLGFLSGMSISAPVAGLVVDRTGDYWPVWTVSAALAAVAAGLMWFDSTDRTPAAITDEMTPDATSAAD
jgi:predicted MFS family arabinose efflux permease